MNEYLDIQTVDLRPKLKQIVAASGLSLRQIAAITGIKKSRLSALLNAQSPLTVPDLQLLGATLGFDPRDLISDIGGFQVDYDADNHSAYQQKAAQIARQLFDCTKQSYETGGTDLTIDTMLRWYMRNDGKLADTDQIDEDIVLIQAPAPLDDHLVPKSIGVNTLTAHSVNSRNPDRIMQYIKSLDNPVREVIIQSYVETAQRNTWQVFERSLTVDFPGAGPRFSLSYATLLMPVVAANNDRLIVNYSTLLSSRPIGPAEASQGAATR